MQIYLTIFFFFHYLNDNIRKEQKKHILCEGCYYSSKSCKKDKDKAYIFLKDNLLVMILLSQISIFFFLLPCFNNSFSRDKRVKQRVVPLAKQRSSIQQKNRRYLTVYCCYKTFELFQMERSKIKQFRHNDKHFQADNYKFQKEKIRQDPVNFL